VRLDLGRGKLARDRLDVPLLGRQLKVHGASIGSTTNMPYLIFFKV